eukprot:752268-Pyramimonas_sp.AAC.1
MPSKAASLPKGQTSLCMGTTIPARRNPSSVVFQIRKENGPGPIVQGLSSLYANGDGVGASRRGDTIYFTNGATKSLPHKRLTEPIHPRRSSNA